MNNVAFSEKIREVERKFLASIAYPKPIMPEPTQEEMARWLADVACPATDGCLVEFDGECPHGYPSWILYLGLI